MFWAYNILCFGTWNKVLGSIEIYRFGGMDHLTWNLHIETIGHTNTQICSRNFKLLNSVRRSSMIFPCVFSEKASCYLPPPWWKCINQRLLLTNALCWIYCLLSESELHNLGVGHDKRSKQSKVRLWTVSGAAFVSRKTFIIVSSLYMKSFVAWYLLELKTSCSFLADQWNCAGWR